MLVGEAFRLQGFEVTETGGSGPDGGVDLVARRGRETFLVQCKQWRAFTVGVDVVREQARQSLARTHPKAQPPIQPPPVAAESVPLCPACNAQMVRRIARKGANAGSEFWGCSAFPKCRGTR